MTPLAELSPWIVLVFMAAFTPLCALALLAQDWRTRRALRLPCAVCGRGTVDEVCPACSRSMADVGAWLALRGAFGSALPVVAARACDDTRGNSAPVWGDFGWGRLRRLA